MKVSVVMAVHNEAQYLPYTLFPLTQIDFDEVIFVLDRCTDNSQQIIEGANIKNMKVLLLIGENDSFPRERAYWPLELPLDYRPAYYIAKKFSQTTSGTHLVIVPRFTHTGHLEPRSEKMTYLWLWAIKSGYFQTHLDV